MAREVITKVWCDLCLQDGAHTEGTETPPIVLGPLKPRVLALCDVHTKEVYDPLRELLTDLGQVVDAAPGAAPRFAGTSPGSGIYPCPDPNCHKHDKPFKHEQSLRNHARGVHGKRINDMRREFPGADGPAEEPANDGAPAVTEAKCDQPDCTVAYTWPEYRSPATALGVHKAKAHGIKGTAKKTRRQAVA